MSRLYASDFVLHYLGRNPLAATYEDVEASLTRLDQLVAAGTVERELHDALGTDDHAVQLLGVRAEAKGRSHAWNAVLVKHVHDGLFTEAWFHIDDQYALDEFLNALDT